MTDYADLFTGKGFRPEPDSPDHWGYEDNLKPKMKLGTAGDIDLREFTSPRHDQRHSSSCVAQAVVKALEIKRIMKEGHGAHVDLSRLAVYYLARELMLPKETHMDDGTFVSHACDVLRRWGVCLEQEWPFKLDKITTSPSWMAMRSAYLHKIDGYYKIRSTGQKRVDEVVRCLQAGNPVVYGTNVGSNWMTYRANSDPLQIPDDNHGGHATVLLGWKDGLFIGENSWGVGWGQNGFYLMDPSVIAWGGSRDFWIVQEGFEEYKGGA